MYSFTFRSSLSVSTVFLLGVFSVITLFATTTPSISTPTVGWHSGSSISIITGSGWSGETISLYSGSILLGTGQIDSSWSYSVVISPILNNLTINLTPVADDGIGTFATGSTITVTHDNIAPTTLVTYSNTGITNQDVIATLTGSNEIINITSTWGSTYTFTANGSFVFTYIDAVGNTGSMIATVNNIDKTAPVLAIIGSAAQTIEAFSGSYSDLGATWSDTVDGTGTISAYTSGSLNMRIPGVYTLTYAKTDTAGNTGSINRSVTIVDTTAPTATLVWSSTQTLEATNGVYSDSGATWTDIVDGTGTIATASSGTVNMKVPGVYMLEYKKVDAALNISNNLVRTVTIVDTTAPKVILNGVSSITIQAGSSFSEPGATWTDIVDWSGLLSSSASGVVNNVLPGTYTLTYRYVDTHWNTGSVDRSVIVIDTIAPTVYLAGSSSMTFEASTGSFVDPGASYTDTVIGIGTISAYTSGSLNMRIPGVYTLTYAKTDTAGNTGSINRSVTIVDTTAPTATLVWSSTQTLEATNGVYSDSGATWTDIVDGTGTIATASSGTVNMKVPGTYILTYAYTDIAGNTGSVIRAVTIVDTTAPSLSLIGSASLTIAHGSVWSEPGVNYTDIVIGTGVITTPFSGSVNTSLVGTYILQYKKIDAAGNTSSVITRTVYVTDQTAPTIVLNNSATTIYIGAIFTDLGATWTDAVDGTGTVFAYSGLVNASVLGTYTIAYKKVDVAGNTSSVIIHTVTVVNPPAPGGSGGGGGWSSYIPPATPVTTTVTTTGSTTMSGTATGVTSTGIIATGSITPIRTPVRKPIIRTPISKAPVVVVSPISVKQNSSWTISAISVIQPVDVSRSMVLNTAKTAIFTTPSIKGKFLWYLVRGNTVTVISIQEGWIQFTFNWITGWSKMSVFAPTDALPPVEITRTPVIDKKVDTYYAAAPRVNIRVSPNATSKSTRHLIGGENITTLSNLGSWTQIQTSDGYTGWVAARYIAPR